MGYQPPPLPPFPSLNLVAHICMLAESKGIMVNRAGKSWLDNTEVSKPSGGSSLKIQILRTAPAILDSPVSPVFRQLSAQAVRHLSGHFGVAGSSKAPAPYRHHSNNVLR